MRGSFERYSEWRVGVLSVNDTQHPFKSTDLTAMPEHVFMRRQALGRLIHQVRNVTLLCALLMPAFVSASSGRITNAQGDCRLFSETGKTVCGRFLDYWDENGGLSQQGFPISDELQEVSDTDGKLYGVQYFERAIFEYHPENKPPYDVLLSLLGAFEYNRRYGDIVGIDQKASSDNPLYFNETGKTLGGVFRDYWMKNGGLRQQGYPISDEFLEANRLDGKIYKVQYFERAVFEWHPENEPPFDVLLSHLGRFRYDRKNYRQISSDCVTLPYTHNGATIAQGANSIPTGLAKIKSYRVEEVALPGSMTCEVLAPNPMHTGLIPQIVTFDTVWRLIVTGERHLSGGNSWYIFVDDILVGVGVDNFDNSELTAIVYDRKLLREGATIGVSYGGNKPSSVLPEKLHFNTLP